MRPQGVAQLADLMTEVGRFREWAEGVPLGLRSRDWECDYDRWNELYDAVLSYVGANPPESWSDEAGQAVLYALARDNEMEHLSEEIRTRHPAALVALTRAALSQGEREARWQLANELGYLPDARGETEELLLILACDEDEYVRRQALGALARIGSPSVERLALEAWNRPDENQEWARMMVLDCLRKIRSPHLAPLLGEAERDERPYLRDFAKYLRQECAG